MLGVERLHVLIKHLSKTRKSIMVGFQNKFSLYFQSEVLWRYDPKHVWTTPATKGSLSQKAPISTVANKVELLGKQTHRTASDRLFKFLEQQWAVLDKPYDVFRDKYDTYVRGTP